MSDTGKIHDKQPHEEADTEKVLAASSAGSGGITSGLQPSGTAPGGGPGTGVGSLGTGGGQSANDDSGNVKGNPAAK